jgi:hypothetical protein
MLATLQMTTSTKSVGTLGLVASLIPVTLYQGNQDCVFPQTIGIPIVTVRPSRRIFTLFVRDVIKAGASEQKRKKPFNSTFRYIDVSTKSVGTIGLVASLIPVTLYQGNQDRNSGISSQLRDRYTPHAGATGMLLHINSKIVNLAIT